MMLSKVVKPRKGRKGPLGKPSDWDIVLAFDWRAIPVGLPLTTRAINKWRRVAKAPLYYVNFKTLRGDDIISVLSNAKGFGPTGRRRVQVTVERQGRIAFYKLVDVPEAQRAR